MVFVQLGSVLIVKGMMLADLEQLWSCMAMVQAVKEALENSIGNLHIRW
jgi:hypothetical protein